METLKLSVKREDRLLKALFDESPRHTYYRELTLNSIEAGASKLVIKEVKIGRNLKVAFVDNGCGLDEEGLKGLADLYGSAKGDDHFGTGARVLTLSTNEDGVIFQSRVDGVTRYIKYYLNKGVPIFEYYNEVFNREVEEEGNYTAVILLGNSSSQRTLKIPYGRISSDYPFKRQIETRFYNPTPTKIFIGNEEVEHLETKLLKGEQYIVKSHLFDIVYTIKGDNTSGVVYDGELYYPIKGRRKDGIFTDNANDLLGKLDAFSAAESLSVIVKLKHFDVNIKQHRDGILHPETRVDIDINYFLEEIKRHIPLEVKVYINSLRREAYSKIEVKTGLEDYSDLDELLNEDGYEFDEGLGVLLPKKVERRPKPCPECGFECGYGAKVCPECGYSFAKLRRVNTDKDKKDRKDRKGNTNKEKDEQRQKSYRPFNIILGGDELIGGFAYGEFIVYLGGEDIYFNPNAKIFVKAQEKIVNGAFKKTQEELAQQIESRVRPVLRGSNVTDRRTTLLIAKGVVKDATKVVVEQLKKGVK